MDDFQEDFTFDPHYSSTGNFSEAARLASTPFCSSTDIGGSLPAPPVSTIKHVPDSTSQTMEKDEENRPCYWRLSEVQQQSFDNTTVNSPRKSLHLRYSDNFRGLNTHSPTSAVLTTCDAHLITIFSTRNMINLTLGMTIVIIYIFNLQLVSLIWVLCYVTVKFPWA